MSRLKYAFVLMFVLAAWAPAQQQPDPAPSQGKPPARSDSEKETESSSRDSKIDLSPPKDDAKNHPDSATAVSDAENKAAGDVQELHPFDPHKAAKDIEVGDYYFKRKNYRAALDRYREALAWKPNDALANLRMAEAYDKLNQPEEAVTRYEEYLRILPQGPFAGEAKTALDRLKADRSQASDKATADKPQ